MKDRVGSLGFPWVAGSVIRAFPSEQQDCTPLCTLPHCPAPPDIAARTLTAPELSIAELRGVYFIHREVWGRAQRDARFGLDHSRDSLAVIGKRSVNSVSMNELFIKPWSEELWDLPDGCC